MTSDIDLTRGHFTLFKHQTVGVAELVKQEDSARGRVWPGCFALFDEMGVGKTLQVIYAAQVLFERGDIDRILIIAPASVKTVWYDPELGELKKHLWDDLPCKITELHAKNRSWLHACEPGDRGRRLDVAITNYEFIRPKLRLEEIKTFCNDRTLLVLDESSAVKNHRAEQTKACMILRRACGRVWLLNGTPIANTPLDMYAQGLIMDPRILNCKNYFHFRARYAVLGGWQNRVVIEWQNLDDMQKRFAPYVLRRLKSEALDLPPKLPPTILTATLTKETWEIYKKMRDQLVAWLTVTEVATASQAGVKAMRLAQICSGFVGGIMETEDLFEGEPGPTELPDRPDFIGSGTAGLEHLTGGDLTRNTSKRVVETDLGGHNDGPQIPVIEPVMGHSEEVSPTREIGREKLDAFLDWLDERLFADPNLKLLVWARFRPEVRRVFDTLATEPRYRRLQVGLIWGGQKKEERQLALRLLDPRTAPSGPAVVIGTPASGSMGINLAAADTVIYLSNDFSLKTRLQSEDRAHRPGQTRPVSYTDTLAVGPSGQKTVDHMVIKSLREKRTLADWTVQAWITALTEE